VAGPLLRSLHGVTVVAVDAVVLGLLLVALQLAVELVDHAVDGRVHVLLGVVCEDLRAGSVDLLLMLDGNPIFDAPVELEFPDALAKALERPELACCAPTPKPGNLEAYQLVMRGRQNILRAQARHEAKQDLERAIALDPDLLDAHAWLAVYYYTDWFNYHREPRHESLVAAFAAADTAIALGPDSSLVIREFLFSPAEHRLGLVARLTQGTMAYLSGVLGKLAPEAVRFETPVATIGIRGTRFAVKAGEPSPR